MVDWLRQPPPHGLLTGQIVFLAAFVGSCEPPNWVAVPRQVNACLERWLTVSALFFPSGMQTAGSNSQAALALGRRGGVPVSGPISASDYVEHFNPGLAHHRVWLLAVLEMCFSSSCATLLAFLKPGVLTGSNGDDQYLARLMRFGDSTDPAAQIKTLASYGITARFSNQACFATLEQQIAAGIPVPCGYLHRGLVSSPTGGGHWLIIVGITPSHLIVHDPLGEADLVTGTTLSGTARFCRYSRQNLGRRWMVEGDGTGWAVLAEG